MSSPIGCVIGVSVVNYHTADAVLALVTSLTRCRRDGGVTVLIALVDNSEAPQDLGPAIGTAAAAGMRAQVIGGHGNLGYAAGNNLGAEWLLDNGADLVWILNPDTRVAPCDLKAMARLSSGDPAVGVTTRTDSGRPDLGAINLWTGRSGAALAGVPAPARLGYAAGHSVVLTRGAWLKLGGLSPAYFLFYEEADLAVRCRQFEIPMLTLSEVSVDHDGGQSTGATADLRRKSSLTYFHASRSCMIFFRRHYPLRLPVAVVARLAYAVRVLVAAGPVSAGAVLRGLVNGLTR
jgi:GT2 family glycosyltransferase